MDVIQHTFCLNNNFDEILPVIKGTIPEEEILTRGFSQVILSFYLDDNNIDDNNKKLCFDNAKFVQQNDNPNRYHRVTTSIMLVSAGRQNI